MKTVAIIICVLFGIYFVGNVLNSLFEFAGKGFFEFITVILVLSSWMIGAFLYSVRNENKK